MIESELSYFDSLQIRYQIMFKTLLLGAANDEENSIKARVTLSENCTEYVCLFIFNLF